MNPQQCREAVVYAAHKIYERQMVNTNEGNVSVCYDGRVYITPSQVCKELLTPEMIVVTDLEGKQLEGTGKASSELLLHLEVYRCRPDVHSVVHTHSPFATAFAIARKPIETKAYTEMIYFYDKIPVAAYGAPGTPAITADVGRVLKMSDVFLLANHGAVAVGRDATDAYLKAESMESLAKTLTINRIIGGEAPLSDEELEFMYRQRKEKLGLGRVE